MHYIVSDSKRKTILPRVVKAAVKLFVKYGIENTSVRDVAAEAGVSVGALYRHFKSKDELAWNIFSTHLNQFSLNLIARVSKSSSMKEKIKAYVSMCFEAFEENKDLFTYLIISEHQALKKFPASHIHPGHVANHIIENGQKLGELKKTDSLVSSSILVGSIIRVCVVRMRRGIHQDLRLYIEPVSESLWNAVKK